MPQTRPFQVLSVTSNKGGVGKTTVAVNLAVYFRALREDLPILLLALDEQPMPERMFALDEQSPKETILECMRSGSFTSAIRLGQYGVHYLPTSPDVAELKREIDDLHQLERALLRTGWEGLVIIDTKSDLEILTRNALKASDLSLVVVEDHASFVEAERLFRLLARWDWPAERARILLSQVDLRIKYRDAESSDILALLLSEIRASGHPLFESFVSRSPKVQGLTTNPERRAIPILHGVPNSLVAAQMRHLAEEVLSALGELGHREATDPPTAEPVSQLLAADLDRPTRPIVETETEAPAAATSEEPSPHTPPSSAPSEPDLDRLHRVEDLLGPSAYDVTHADLEPRTTDPPPLTAQTASIDPTPSPPRAPRPQPANDRLLSIEDLLGTQEPDEPPSAHEVRPPPLRRLG